MTLDLLLALLTFSAVTVFSPGPNNLMLMASGANYGLRRSFPHMLGIILGFPAMIMLVGLGVMQLFEIWPPLQTVLKVASILYMVYLAWKIAQSGAPKEGKAVGKPLTFLQSAAFQWVNPKGWAMALGAISLYAHGREVAAVALIAFAYVLTGSASTTTWVVIGENVGRLLANPVRLRLFNWTMAALLIASMIPVLLGL
ncbi:LysE family translocator [Pseudoprimorskyibacter insulae]|uniref:Cysteine/O-acetylserine efflux protein n=1 Tax=Pseudoprimorskyibacter insulae TaxID=1695997 RepID=A0A2R8AVD8_9RHOB|nr:LysE family translocator [Pseudoprimorskyibacter insulae]SPF79874.1 Cysteine/O-acetylserine efflux protein [Pseudoprimorskyibacter insulae]